MTDPALSLTKDVLLSPVFQEVIQITDNMTAPMTWDSYWRMAYDRADKVLQAQANELLKRGNITKQEFDQLVRARNTLVEEFRQGGPASSESVERRPETSN